MTTPAPSYDEFRASLQQLTGALPPPDPAARKPHEDAAQAFQGLGEVNRQALTELIRVNPRWVPILGSVIGLSQEQLKNILMFHFNTGGWILLGRNRPEAIIEMFDDEYDLVNRIEAERARMWSYGDVLFERAESTRRAARAITRGRKLEDEVEELVKSLGLDYVPRTEFIGADGQVAPCDLAIPTNGAGALIVCAVKANNSTGSKQSDAYREVKAMVDARYSRQFVYVVVDGIGWLSRQADLKRIFRLWERRSIDGMFTLAQFDSFRADLIEAARIHRLL